MIEKILQLIQENWETLPLSGQEINTGDFGITKFCQRIVGHDTKVLFYITHRGIPLCIVKIMRDASFNEKLRREANSQKEIISTGAVFVPRVYFGGSIDGLYVYAEEVVSGHAISKDEAEKNILGIIQIVRSFPVYGQISTNEIASVFSKHIPREDKQILDAINNISNLNVLLSTGLTHGDFGRVNIMYNSGILKIIDWGRAGERPLWLIDAVYFLVKLKNVHNREEWRFHAMPIFLKSTGVEEKVGVALYDVWTLYEILYKKHPRYYMDVIKEIHQI